MKKVFTILLVLYSAVTHAQTACDSVDISVHYFPYYDTLLEVNVTNNSSRLFDYPGLVVYNSLGDTIAKEVVNLFGLGQSSTHILSIRPGTIPANTFNGSVQLWTGFYDSLECSYGQAFQLCPDTCHMIHPFLGNLDTGTMSASVTWTLLNSSLQVVDSGTLTIASFTQYVIDTICAAAGNYTLHFHTIGSTTGGTPYVGLSTNGLGEPDIRQPLATNVSVPFSMYAHCIPTGSVKPLANPSVPAITSFGGKIHILNTSGYAIGEVTVYTIDGKTAYKSKTEAAEQWIDLSYLASGIYIVKINYRGNNEYKKVLLNN